MRRNAVFSTLVLSLFLISLAAQEAFKKPDEQMRKWAIFAGKWKLDEVTSASPFGPAGKANYDTVGRLTYNGHFYEERGTGKANGAPLDYTILVHYDSSAKAFKSFYYDSNGTVLPLETTVEGNTIRSTGSSEVNGKKYRVKSVSTLSSDGKRFQYDWQYSEDGQNWKPIFKGTGTRVSD